MLNIASKCFSVLEVQYSHLFGYVTAGGQPWAVGRLTSETNTRLYVQLSTSAGVAGNVRSRGRNKNSSRYKSNLLHTCHFKANLLRPAGILILASTIVTIQMVISRVVLELET